MLTLSLAATIYWVLPAWIVRRRKLQPLNVRDAPDVVDYLCRLCEGIGLAHKPSFVWNPLNPRISASAFGRRGHYYVALSGGLVTRFYTDQCTFRAVMLHELAHLRHADVDTTYFTIAVQCAFVAVPLIPSAASLLWPGLTWVDIYSTLSQIIISTILVLLTGLSVLRVREFYADVRASVWDKTSVNLDRVLRGFPSFKGGRWLAALHLHPDPYLRRQILAETQRLFRLGFWDAFAVGIAVGMSIGTVQGALFVILAPEFSQPQQQLVLYLAVLFGIPLCFIPVAIGAVGIGVWRGTYAMLITGKGTDNAGWLGFGFALGLVFTYAVTGFGYAIARVADKSFSSDWVLFNVGLITAGNVILLISLFLIFKWLAAMVAAWLQVVLQSNSPRPALIVSIGITVVLVVVWIGTAVLAPMLNVFLRHAEWNSSGTVYVYPLVFGSVIFLSSVLMWAFILAAWFWRKQTASTSVSAWVFLDGIPDKRPSPVPLYPRQALMIGIVMGLVFCLALEGIYFRKYLPSEVTNVIQSAFSWAGDRADQVFGTRGFEIAMFAAILQALAAAIVAGYAGRLGVVHGLFAASIAGIVMAIGNYPFSVAGPYETTLVSMTFLGLGAILAVPAAIVATPVGNGARRVTSFIKAVRNKTDDFRSTPKDPPQTTLKLEREKGAQSGVLLEDNTHIGRKGPAWVLSSGGFIALLITVVIVGEAYRIRDVVVEIQERTDYRKAAEQGDADAQYHLGRTFAEGRAVAQDDAQAVLWLRQAAEQGHVGAQYDLAGMYFMGRGVRQDDAQALLLLRQAAEQGHVGAQNNLGGMYSMGRGVRQDDAQAMLWFHKAADQGHADSQNNLGMMYWQGRAVAQDDAQAVLWFHKAAEQGHAGARQHLQTMCARGISQACP